MGWGVALSSLLIGGFLGTGRLGFARGFSALLTHKQGEQAINSLVLAVAITLVILPLSYGISGLPDIGQFHRPLSVSLGVGAFMFGIGMAMAQTCTSGAIRRLGNLESSAIVVLVGLVIGATVATFHFDFWTMQPALGPVRLTDMGLLPALGLTLLIATLFFWAIVRWTQTPVGELLPSKAQIGLIALFTLAVAWFAISVNRPWGLSTVFPLGSVEILQRYFPALDLDFMGYWLQPDRESVLINGLMSDVVVWHVIGLMCGALAYTLMSRASIVSTFKIQRLIPSFLGGLLMGYGSLLAYGCNVGGFLGGVASGSLHGWIWLVFALFGVGVYHRVQSSLSQYWDLFWRRVGLAATINRTI
ncbi:MAG: YeeE/YedE family protein [Gammaproteobacteria bacterium]|nr:YeeE/YedE family protein [Gammaproteobacteria bacterium]